MSHIIKYLLGIPGKVEEFFFERMLMRGRFISVVPILFYF